MLINFPQRSKWLRCSAVTYAARTRKVRQARSDGHAMLASVTATFLEKPLPNTLSR